MSWVKTAQRLLSAISGRRKFSTLEINELSQLRSIISKILNEYYNNQNRHLKGN